MLRESWSGDWTTRWQPFGTPPAEVIQTNRGSALLPNGDGSYPSGAFLREAFAVSKGAGVEFTASLPVTRSQWQTLSVFIMDGALLPAMRAWDQRTGPGPAFIDWCGFSAPGNNSTSAHAAVQLTARQRLKRVPVSRTLFDGSWHVLRLQLLEDGRCALAIDGVAVDDAGPVGGLPAAAFVTIVGDDRFGGRLVVRHVEAWSGVRGGVDWTILDVLPSKRE
jgi:hypothetical protein